MDDFIEKLQNEIKKTYSVENQNLKNLSSVELFIHFGYPEKFLLKYKKLLKYAFPIAFPFENIDLKDKKILDLGCGIGLDSVFALDNGAKKVYAIDMSESFLNNGIKNDNLLKIKGNMENIFFKNLFVDVIVMNGSLSLVVNKNSLLDKLNVILEENGYLIICDLFWKENTQEREYFNKDLNSWCWCVGGCLTKNELFNIALKSGYEIFDNVIYENIEELERVKFILKK